MFSFNINKGNKNNAEGKEILCGVKYFFGNGVI